MVVVEVEGLACTNKHTLRLPWAPSPDACRWVWEGAWVVGLGAWVVGLGAWMEWASRVVGVTAVVTVLRG